MNNVQRITLGLLVVAVVGCGGSGSGIVGQQSPRVRLFNGALGEATDYATYQDSSLNNLGVSPNAAYGTATTDTIVTNTNVTATIMASTGALVTSPAVLLRENSDYTAYAYGAAFQGYHAMIVEDSEAVVPGAAFGVRSINLSTKNTNLDIFVQPSSTSFGSSPQLFSSLAYGSVSGSSNTSSAVDANGYVVQALNGVTTYTVTVTAHNSLTILATGSVTVNQGSHYSVVAYDSPVGSSTQTSVVIIGDTRSS